MWKRVEGDLLEADVDALVNTINTVGVMGKGIALQFKHRFPDNYTAYRAAVAQGQVRIGKMFVTETGTSLLGQPRCIINFPTKAHWRQPSQYAYIQAGLADLVSVIQARGIRSIALPALGCGNGQLDITRVEAMMVEALGSLPDLEVHLYMPAGQDRPALPVPVVLSVEQASLLYLLFHYEALGDEASAFVAQKLLYFLGRFGERGFGSPFRRHHYGPYHPDADALLQSLPGSHIQGHAAFATKPFAPLQLDYARYAAIKDQLDQGLDPVRRARLDAVIHLVDGFHSTWSLEVLASVDMLLQEAPLRDPEQLLADIRAWNARKADLVHPHHVAVAIARLRELQPVPAP